MKIVIVCLCMALLISCTSDPVGVRYYLLHTPENNVPNHGDDTKPIAVLQSLNVADYLRDSSLVMQVNQYELQYSRQDVWAEKLQSSFYKALLQDLNGSNNRSYVAESSPNAMHAETAIIIKLDHFHITDASSVVSSGRYWLSVNESQKSKNIDPTASSHTFYFESPLKQDGYAHAVEQLRALVDNLAKQIKKDITALPNN